MKKIFHSRLIIHSSFFFTPHDSTASRATFSSNNFKFLYVCIVYQSLTLVGKNCASLFFTKALGSLRFVGIHLYTALATARAFQLELWSGFSLGYCTILIIFFLGLFFQLFYWPVVWPAFQQNCCCWTDDLTFVSKIIWYIKEFTVTSMSVKSPGPVAAKISTNHHTSTLYVWQFVCGVSANMLCFGFLGFFLPNMPLCITVKHLCFGLTCPKDSRSLVACFRSNFANLNCAAVFFLGRRFFLLACFPNKLFNLGFFKTVQS